MNDSRTQFIPIRIKQTRAQRLASFARNYRRSFGKRNVLKEFVPQDPLEFHLSYLAHHWFRLICFCREFNEKPEVRIDDYPGTYIEVISLFAKSEIKSGSPIFDEWTEYWRWTQKILNVRPIALHDVEKAFVSIDKCCAKLNFDPWISPTKENVSFA